jgi:hypothetical protein
MKLKDLLTKCRWTMMTRMVNEIPIYRSVGVFLFEQQKHLVFKTAHVICCIFHFPLQNVRNPTKGILTRIVSYSIQAERFCEDWLSQVMNF